MADCFVVVAGNLFGSARVTIIIPDDLALLLLCGCSEGERVLLGQAGCLEHVELFEVK